jgi:hypothetical protein
MSERPVMDDAHVRAKLLEYRVSERLLNRLQSAEALDLLDHIEAVLANYEKALDEMAERLPNS